MARGTRSNPPVSGNTGDDPLQRGIVTEPDQRIEGNDSSEQTQPVAVDNDNLDIDIHGSFDNTELRELERIAEEKENRLRILQRIAELENQIGDAEANRQAKARRRRDSDTSESDRDRSGGEIKIKDIKPFALKFSLQ